jgi:hypothetical protein
MGDRPPVASHPANGVFHNQRGDQRPKRQGQQREENEAGHVRHMFDRHGRLFGAVC